MTDNLELEPPLFLVLAGPNGAGKSTFYRTHIKDNPFFNGIDFINWDEEYKRLTSNPATVNKLSKLKPNSDEYQQILRGCMIESGKIVMTKITEHLENKHSFIYETVSASSTHLRLMQTAKSHGFRIATIFIGLSNVNLSMARVHQRVLNGGHNVPTEDILRRYPVIIKKFPLLLSTSDTSIVCDNSGSTPFKVIFLKSDDLTRTFSKFPNYLQHNEEFTDFVSNEDKIMVTNAYYKTLTEQQQDTIIQNVLGKIRL